MRVVTFNTEHARVGGGEVPDADALGEAIAALGPDIVALQETDQGDPASGGVDQPGVVASAIGGTAVFAPQSLGGGTGVALVARGRIDDVEVLRFVSRHGPRRGRPIAVPLLRPARRAILLARVTVDARPVAVASVHLDLVRKVGHVQLERVVAALAQRPHPRLLMGDLNRWPQRVRATVAAGGLELLGDDTPTHPVDRPKRRIDHIAASGFRVVRTEVVRLPVSDHRALVADLEPA